jgi:predicted TIM-barrel fold metal-dependent hydrolase
VTIAHGCFDSDGHVLEPRQTWAALAPEHAVRIERDSRGLDHVVVGDQEIFVASLGHMGTPGTDVGRRRPLALEDARPGAFDPTARLADMDAETIDAVVLYPTIGLGAWGLTDPGAALAVARAYNDWLASYCSAAPDRLHGAAMVPFQDPAAAVAELRRAREELGFVAAFVRPNPCLGRTLADPAHDTVWEAAEELGVAVAVHEGLQPAVPHLASGRQPTNALLQHAASHTFEQMFALAQLVSCGVLERHPSLRLVFLEAGGGWLPYWLERLDHHVATYGAYAPEMRLRPSEYFARQCWISFEIDEPLLPILAPSVGTDRIVWGSDYPHADSTFPGAVKELRDTIAPLPADDQARILERNGRALYGL